VTRYLLDANAVIGLLNDAASGLRRARREKPADVAISAIVAHELFYAAFKSQQAERSVGGCSPVCGARVRQGGRPATGKIRALLASKRTPIGPYDVLIAG
jgi:tRNA(fMet)-specific endonuclease VapC